MLPVLFHLGPITVYSFGVMAALGFVVAGYLIGIECCERGYQPGMADSLVVFGAIAGFAGSRIYDVFDNWPEYAGHPWSIIFSGAGFVWYGGFIGGFISAYLVARYYKVPFLIVADICAAPLVLGMAFGRMGCQLSGDGDWGLPSTLPWAMAYPHAIVGWHGDLHLPNGSLLPSTVLKLGSHWTLVDGFFPGVRVHPTPIYEIIMYVAIFALLWSMRRRIKFNGERMCLYMILAGSARFLVEFLRINPRVFWCFSEAQLFSILMIIVGFALYYTLSSPAIVVEHELAMRAAP